MQNYDLAIIGNGIIATISALQVSKLFPSLKIVVIAPQDRRHAASTAAGAMHAVFCEVEDTFRTSTRDQDIFNLSLAARQDWIDLLDEYEFQDLITADSTIMYMRKQGTLFETANFEIACEVAKEHGCLEDVDKTEISNLFQGKLGPDDLLAQKFAGEFALDPERLLHRADKILIDRGVHFIDDTIVSVKSNPDTVELTLSANSEISVGKTVVAAGSHSSNLLPASHGVVPIFHAVGTAAIIETDSTNYDNLDYVVRTPNRGGAQCGIHILPRSGTHFYLGAGNYLSDQEPAHRLETARYLIEICEDELIGKQSMYTAKAEFLLGSRPKSLDGYPLVGPLEQHPNVFVASGMYRIGLTIAPKVATEVVRWINGSPQSNSMTNYAPDRNFHSYGKLDDAKNYFAQSRISNLVEHSLLDYSDEAAVLSKRTELETIASTQNSSLVEKHNFPADFVVDPDMYSILSSINPIGYDK